MASRGGRAPYRGSSSTIRQLLDAVDASGATDEAVLKRAGVARHTLTLLRRGHSITTISLDCLAEALGMEVRLVPRSSVLTPRQDR